MNSAHSEQIRIPWKLRGARREVQGKGWVWVGGGSEKNYKSFFLSFPEYTPIEHTYQGVGCNLPVGFITLPAQS